MNRRGQLDDYGQVDGDASSPFATTMTSQPWLRAGTPPWHMWGNTIAMTISQYESEGTLPVVSTGQLIKVAYGRPETWHWLFSARLLTAPTLPAGPPQQVIVELHWDLIIGLGRSQVSIPDFDYFRWSWLTPTVPTPLGPKWSTNGRTPSLVDSIVVPIGPDDASRRLVDQITAQDIQLSCRAHAFFDAPPNGQVVKLEVSAYVAPKTHVRPDWYVKGPPEVMFGGAETQGR